MTLKHYLINKLSVFIKRVQYVQGSLALRNLMVQLSEARKAKQYVKKKKKITCYIFQKHIGNTEDWNEKSIFQMVWASHAQSREPQMHQLAGAQKMAIANAYALK